MLDKIVEAYINEIANEKSHQTYIFRGRTNAKRGYAKKYLFKIGKISNLSTWKYRLFYTFSAVYAKVWLVMFFIVLLQFLGALCFFRRSKKFANNIGFIASQKTVYDLNLTGLSHIDHIGINYFSFFRETTAREKWAAFIVSVKAIWKVYCCKSEMSPLDYNSIKLHLNDVYKLSLYAVLINRLVKNNADCALILNSHYERWTYIASKLCGDNLTIVQHGRLLANIKFPHHFGKVNHLYLYNEQVLQAFKNYYGDIEHISYIKPKLNLVDIEPSNKITVLIISSILSVDDELALIKFFESCNNVSVFLKFHPAYNYSHYFKGVINGVDVVDYLPKVDVTVTYNSALGDEYLALGQKVIFIEDYDNLAEVKEELLDYGIVRE